MKLHDLRPAPGSKSQRTRVGRGIAAGKGKTAGRGTKGQKSRAGGRSAAWHEGGQTPIHIRVPKLRGFKRRFKVEYEVVNVGRISEYADRGRFAEAESAGEAAVAAQRASRTPPRKSTGTPLTVNAEILRQANLIGNVRRPVKVLGAGDVTRKLFIVADAFTKSAREKIEAAGGTAQVLVVATESGNGGEQGENRERPERGERRRPADAERRDHPDHERNEPPAPVEASAGTREG